MYNQSLLGVKKRLGHAQIGLLKRSDQHPRCIHMVVPPGRQPSKAQSLTVNRRKSNFLRSTVKNTD